MESNDNLKPLYLLLISIFVIWIISIVVVNSIYDSPEFRAFLGDSFGTINSLFSGLAFAGIIYTILLQRKELALQRQELKETRNELARSANAQERSELQQKRQSENLKQTAKLNALSTLVSYYANIESKNKNKHPSAAHDARREQEHHIQRIKQILEQKDEF